MLRKLNWKQIGAWIMFIALLLSALPVSAGAADQAQVISLLEQLTRDDRGAYMINGPEAMDIMIQVCGLDGYDNGNQIEFKLCTPEEADEGYSFECSQIKTVSGANVRIDRNGCDLKLTDEIGIQVVDGSTLELADFSEKDGTIYAHKIKNEGELSMFSNNFELEIENSGTLKVSTKPIESPKATITLLTNREGGAAEIRSVSIDNITCWDTSSVTLSDGEIAGPIILNDESQLSMPGEYYGDRVNFFGNAITLNDSSQMEIKSLFYCKAEEPVKVTCTNPERLKVHGFGEFSFNPTPYLVVSDSAQFVMRTNNGLYTTSYNLRNELTDLSIIPESRVFDGMVDVRISSSTLGAQVYYSTEEPVTIDSQTDISSWRTVTLPVGSMIYALALAEHYGACEKDVEIQATPFEGVPYPGIFPDKSGETYKGSVLVTIKMPDGYENADIYYTISQDGQSRSTATGGYNDVIDQESGEIKGTKYTGSPINLTYSALIQAIAVINGEHSEVARQWYYVESNSMNPTVPDDAGTGGGSGGTGGGSSSGGGGGGSSSSGSGSNQSNTSTTKNPDGSTTTTTTDKATGTITEVTKGKDGTVTTVETKKDGSVTETVKSGGMTSTVVTDKDGAITKAEVNIGNVTTNQTVVLPVGVPVVSNITFAPKLEIYLADTSSNIKVAIPVKNATTSTVAVLVAADGSEKIVPTSVVTAEGVVLSLDGSATIKVVDNSKDFADVSPSFWASDSVAFVTSRELFNGTNAETFTPNAPMTREMLMTVLARLDGADTTASPLAQGMAWATEKGISDGSNPGGSISREQLATMLYRYAGSPEASGSLADFNDADSVGGYAQEAMQWAVGNGIISGTGSETLNPQGEATRAQVAAMLQRYIVGLNG